MTFTIRPYQEAIVSATEAAWNGAERATGSGVVNGCLWDVATGGGKTVMSATLIARTLRAVADNARQGRALWLVNRDELAQQAVRTFREIMPELSIGIVKAGEDDYHRQLVVGSVQTLQNEKRRRPIRDVVVIGSDEAHHAAPGTKWAEILDHFGGTTPLQQRGVRSFGVTATPERQDNKHLGKLWNEVVARWTILDGIRGGYLTDIRGRRVHVRGLDISSLRRTAGDLQAGQLGEMLHDARALDQAFEAWGKFGERRSTVAFWPTVATAHEFAGIAHAAGIDCDVVDGTTPLHVRAQYYERSRRLAEQGIPHILSNCMVLTEGFDAPWLSCVLWGRLTESRALFQQGVGRGVRTWTNPITHAVKADCLLLDLVGSAGKHKLVGLKDLTLGAFDDGDELADDELLSEAVERAEQAAPRDEEPAIAGHVVAREFDPFAGVTSAWLSTYGGVPFILCRDLRPETKRAAHARARGTGGNPWALVNKPPEYAIYVVPSQHGVGLHDVRSVRVDARGWPSTVVAGVSYEWARTVAEQRAQEVDPELANAAAPWRDTKKPTDTQYKSLQRLGIPPPQGATRGQMSDLIACARATRAIHYGAA